MATTLPSPNSPPPASGTNKPPSPQPLTSPPPQPNVDSPDPATPSNPSPPPESPPPALTVTPPHESPPPLVAQERPSQNPPPPTTSISPSSSQPSPRPTTPSDPPKSPPSPPPSSPPPPTSRPSPAEPAPPPTSRPSPAEPAPPPTSRPPPVEPDPPPSSPPPPVDPAQPPSSPPPPVDPAQPPSSPPPPPQSSLSPPQSALPPLTPSTPPRNPPPPPTTLPPSDSPPSPPPKKPPTTPSPLSSNPSPPPPSPQSSPPSTLVPVAPNPPSLGSPPPKSQISSANNSFSAPIPSTSSKNSPENDSIGIGGLVAIGAAGGIVMLGLIGLVIWCMNKQRKKTSQLNGDHVTETPTGSSAETDSYVIKVDSSAPLVKSCSDSSNFVHSPTEPGGLGNSRSWFSYDELFNATNGFSTGNLLGSGGFGSVYKGSLPDGRDVAVKQLKIGGGQGEREFRTEVEIITRIHHRHLVLLVGYCISDNRRLLVYDYVSNDTLHFHLHGKGRPVLDWATRVKVASGAARGIAYLHEDCHPRIIHRDIKSSNILLDNNFEARVSDFGLAKLALDANTHITTRVMGTFGYMAPEYASSGKLTEKSDVYSFGVVLLELITGRKPVDTSQPMGDESLVEWARPLLRDTIENGNFESLADPRLENDYVESEMVRMIEAAAACVRHSAARRPKMGQVVRAFENLAASDLTNGMRLGQSEIIDSAAQSAEIRSFRRMRFGSQ